MLSPQSFVGFFKSLNTVTEMTKRRASARRFVMAVTVGFEPTEGVALTRFRGELLRPLGHVTGTNFTWWRRVLPGVGQPLKLRAK